MVLSPSTSTAVQILAGAGLAIGWMAGPSFYYHSDQWWLLVACILGWVVFVAGIYVTVQHGS